MCKKLVWTKNLSINQPSHFEYCEFRSKSADNCCGRGDLDAVCRQQGGGRERTGTVPLVTGAQYRIPGNGYQIPSTVPNGSVADP
jgi:hypothetical protein